MVKNLEILLKLMSMTVSVVHVQKVDGLRNNRQFGLGAHGSLKEVFTVQYK